VRELEEKASGSSTYATFFRRFRTANTPLEKGKFFPTELGKIVTELLVKSFPTVLDLAFTADMENKLDAIETRQ